MTTLDDLVIPVIESAMIVAAHYAKQCGRSTVTATDVQYGMKFAARNVPGRITQPMFPEIYDSSDSDESFEEVPDDDEPFTRYTGEDDYCIRTNEADSSDSDESFEEVPDDDEPFTRYTGEDDYCIRANEAVDTWADWVPESPLEQHLKNAIDSHEEAGRVPRD